MTATWNASVIAFSALTGFTAAAAISELTGPQSARRRPGAQQLARVMGAALNEEHATPDKSYLEYLGALILADAGRHGYDPMWYLSIGWIESRYRPYARSSSGAEGVWQQKPHYAHPDPVAPGVLFDPRLAVRAFGEKIASMERRWGPVGFDHWAHYHDGNTIRESGIAYAERRRRTAHYLTELLERDRRSPLQVDWGVWPFEGSRYADYNRGDP